MEKPRHPGTLTRLGGPEQRRDASVEGMDATVVWEILGTQAGLDELLQQHRVPYYPAQHAWVLEEERQRAASAPAGSGHLNSGSGGGYFNPSPTESRKNLRLL